MIFCGTGIIRNSASLFTLVNVGTYLVMFQVSVKEAGQLELTLNGNEIAYTVSGRETTSSLISNFAIITTNSKFIYILGKIKFF